MYGSATTIHILKCNHYKSTLRAQFYSYMGLYGLALDGFFKDDSQLKDACLESAEQCYHACGPVDKSTYAASVKRTKTHLETAICTANVTEEFQTWKQRPSKNAMFRPTLNYMHNRVFAPYSC